MSRYLSGDGYVIEYPNRLAYAGMPALVSVSRADDYIGVSVTITIDGSVYVEKRSIYSGGATFDISRYMQTAFVGKDLSVGYGDEQTRRTNLAQDVEIAVVLTADDGSAEEALTFDVKALCGYIAYGQTNGGVKYRKVYANYPQTFDFYSTSDTSLSVVYDNGEEYDIEPLSIEGGIEQTAIELSRWWSVPSDARSGVLKGNNVMWLVGDNELEGDCEYRLSIDRSTSGVYIRWIDHFGQWCYYLFRVTGENYTAQELQTWMNSALRDGATAVNNVVQSPNFLNQEMEVQHTISLGAKLVDAETFDFLLSFITSSRVEVMLNAEDYQEDSTTMPVWERVNIVAGSYARTGAHLQDFMVSIARTAHKSTMR